MGNTNTSLNNIQKGLKGILQQNASSTKSMEELIKNSPLTQALKTQQLKNMQKAASEEKNKLTKEEEQERSVREKRHRIHEIFEIVKTLKEEMRPLWSKLRPLKEVKEELSEMKFTRTSLKVENWLQNWKNSRRKLKNRWDWNTMQKAASEKKKQTDGEKK